MAKRIPDLMDEALSALRNEKYARAVALADQLAEDLPNHPLVRAIRAQGLLYSAHPEEALTEAQKSVELNPTSAHAQSILGYAAWRTERMTLAQGAFEAAVRFSDRAPFFLAEYAWFMANERGPGLALPVAQKAVEANDESSTAWAALGLVQFRQKRVQEAEISLRRALGLNPNDLYAQSALLTLLHDQRRNEEAEELKASLSQHAGTEELLDSLDEESRDRKLAAMLLERNIDLDAPRIEPKNYQGIVVVASAIFVGLTLWFLAPDQPLMALAFSLLPLLLLWFLGRLWR